MKQYTVIGDIHGCFDTFIALLAKIPKEDTIVLCGDLVDRGPKSKQVVQYVIDNNILCVSGNHEDMMATDILKDLSSPYFGNWKADQAHETFDSYRKDDYSLDMDLMIKHAERMKNLPTYLEFTDVKNEDDRHLVVSHSSIFSMWNHKDESNFREEVMWNRDYINKSQCLRTNIFNIFGHTPVYGGLPIITPFYANADTGCVFNRTGYDVLTAIRFPSMEIIQQNNIDNENSVDNQVK